LQTHCNFSYATIQLWGGNCSCQGKQRERESWVLGAKTTDEHRKQINADKELRAVSWELATKAKSKQRCSIFASLLPQVGNGNASHNVEASLKLG